MSECFATFKCELYHDYMAEPSVKIIANWQDVTAPNASDTILTATNPAKTTVYATVTGKSPVAEIPWVNNNVLISPYSHIFLV